MMKTVPTPTEIKLRQQHRLLQITFSDRMQIELPAEYLRVYSPSAEVRGHGLSEPKLITGKENVTIVNIEPIGNYAIKLIFDDGHNSGIYSWEILYDLATNYTRNWQRYLERLAKNKHHKM